MNHGINSHGKDQVIPEYFGSSIRRVNVWPTRGNGTTFSDKPIKAIASSQHVFLIKNVLGSLGGALSMDILFGWQHRQLYHLAATDICIWWNRWELIVPMAGICQTYIYFIYITCANCLGCRRKFTFLWRLLQLGPQDVQWHLWHLETRSHF